MHRKTTSSQHGKKKKALQNTDKSDLKGGTYKNLIRDAIFKVVPYALA